MASTRSAASINVDAVNVAEASKLATIINSVRQQRADFGAWAVALAIPSMVVILGFIGLLGTVGIAVGIMGWLCSLKAIVTCLKATFYTAQRMPAIINSMLVFVVGLLLMLTTGAAWQHAATGCLIVLVADYLCGRTVVVNEEEEEDPKRK